MRSKNAIKNLAIYIVYEAFVFILGMIFPRYIILQYGSEINGLTSTITRILSLINLIQAGAVGAAIYQMYKPVAENDFETQSAILFSSKRYYKRITVIYLIVAVAVGLFYGLYLQSALLSFFHIFLSFCILAINGAGTLLFRSICDIYISPHQKKYYITIGLIAEQIVRYGSIAFVLMQKMHFVYIYISYLLGGITAIIINLFFYKKLSKGKITKSPKNQNYVIPDKRFLMLQSIGSEAVTASPTIIISTFIGLVESSVFSVYSMVFTSMKTIISSIQLSLSAIFGNLVKTSSDEYIFEVYDVIELFTIMLGCVLSPCVGFLLPPFINLYSAGVADANYYQFILVVFVVAYTAVFCFRSSFGYVATVYGLFRFTCKITLIFGGLGIIISLVCSLLFGMPYVMVGLLFNQIGCSLTILFRLKKEVKWFRVNAIIRRVTLLVIMSCSGILLFVWVNPRITGWGDWIKYGCLCGAGSILSVFTYCCIFERKQIRKIMSYAKNLIIKHDS